LFHCFFLLFLFCREKFILKWPTYSLGITFSFNHPCVWWEGRGGGQQMHWWVSLSLFLVHCLGHWELCRSVLLYVHRDRTDYKGRGALAGHLDFHKTTSTFTRPPRLSHSSWALKNVAILLILALSVTGEKITTTKPFLPVRVVFL